MVSDHQTVTALVLAGTRNDQDPVARLVEVPNKILAHVGGEPMISRVLQTLEKSHTVGKRILCGPSWDTVQDHAFLKKWVQSGEVHWIEPLHGPSVSVERFLHEHRQEYPILITTADHPLLTPEMVDYFLRESRQTEADVTVGLVPYTLIAASYPQSKRTVTRFTGGGYCGSNLFCLFTSKAERLVEFWSHIEQERKHPLRLIRTLGGMVLIRYVFGRLSLSEALARLSRRLDLHVKEILLPFPEAAIDVDTPEDLALAEKILGARGQV
jgi:GTP:adenosylcobinamide-phosphate guanylyltransferase